MRMLLKLLMVGMMALGWSGVARGQSLAEVLTAVQKRKQVVAEKNRVNRDLARELNPSLDALDPPALITWGFDLEEFPESSEVNALTVTQQVSLLKKAWRETNSLSASFLDVRKIKSGAGAWHRLAFPFEQGDEGVTGENFGASLRLLAARLRQMTHVADWPFIANYSYATHLQTYTTSTTSVLVDPVEPQAETSWGTGRYLSDDSANQWAMRYSIGAYGTYSSTYASSAVDKKFEHWAVVGNIQTKAPEELGGEIRAFVQPKHEVTVIQDLPGYGDDSDPTIYHAGSKMIASSSLSDTITTLGLAPIMGGTSVLDATGLTFPGTWGYEGSNVYHYRAPFPGQTANANLDLKTWSYSTWDPSVTEPNPAPLIIRAAYVADFGTEFVSPAAAPEEALPLRIEPDLANRLLKVRLASSFANDCELVWRFPWESNRAVSARNALDVRGSGDWDAVYSGRLEDREPQREWSGTASATEERWVGFSQYVDDWWAPVLKQVVTATYGVDIVQAEPASRFKYVIKFYRRDQVGAKNEETGLYAFTEPPVEEFLVENPAADDEVRTGLKITGNKLVYEVTQTGTAWDFTAKNKATPPVTMWSTHLVITPATYDGSWNIITPFTVEETVAVDGVTQPIVTKTYEDSWANPQLISGITEAAGGTEGTRTTIYTFAETVRPYLTLATISETGGIDPYTAMYDEHRLLTHLAMGSSKTTITPSPLLGNVIARMEQFGTTGAEKTVSVQATVYTEGMTRLTTMVADAPGAVPMVVEYYPANHTVNPWGLKMTRGADGTLTTYTYAWVGDDFKVTVASGGEATAESGVVAMGTKIVTKFNKAGRMILKESYDLWNGEEKLLDKVEKVTYQSGTLFPSKYSCALETFEEYTYEADGQVATAKDRLQKVTGYTYDALGRVTQVKRGDSLTSPTLTTTISYNMGLGAGQLGRTVTVTPAVGTARTQVEKASFLGKERTVTATGPETVTTTETENATTLTRTTTNTTTHETVTETTTKATLGTTIRGNATEPWNISYEVPATGGGWKKTVGHDTSANLKTVTTQDALGRVVKEETPNRSGVSAALAATDYHYANGRVDYLDDPAGRTSFLYAVDGTVERTTRSGRYVERKRVTDSDANIMKWQVKGTDGPAGSSPAVAVPLLQETKYHIGTRATTEIPWGIAERAVTTTPSISTDEMTLEAIGTNLNVTKVWKDGRFLSSDARMGEMTLGASAVTNAFGDMNNYTLQPGKSALKQQKTSFTAAGRVEKMEMPLMPDTVIGHSFAETTANVSTTVTRNGKEWASTVTGKGDVLSSGGYGTPDVGLTAPNYTASTTEVKKTVTTAGGELSAEMRTTLSGQVKLRKHPDGKQESFGRNAAGFVTQWTTPRHVISIGRDGFGDVTGMTLPAPSAALMNSVSRDGGGRLVGWMDRAGAHTQSYEHGQPDVAGHSGGVLGTASVNRDYTDLGELEKITLSVLGTETAKFTQYGYYSEHGDLNEVTTAGGKVGEWSDFDAATGRPQTFILSGLVVETEYDKLGRVKERTLSFGSGPGATTQTYTYSYDADGHCDSVVTPRGTWTLGYSAHGYLNAASRTLGELAAPVFSYAFDEAGRKSGTTGDYYPKMREHLAPVVEVKGSVNTGGTLPVVTINGGDPVTLDGGKFKKVYEALTEGWKTFIVRGVIAGAGPGGADEVAEEIERAYVPPASEVIKYDDSGNRSEDTRWSYQWNELDQLVTAVEQDPPPGAPPLEIGFVYDMAGRRMEKKVWQGGALWRRTTMLYDGWRPVREVEYDGGGVEVARRVYSWGPDVSGSLEGAAGIGGLLEVLETKGGVTTKNLVLNDGRGNVVGLVDADTGALVASYDHGPFGEMLDKEGERVSSCPLRWQTKYYDEEMGLYYFGKRYYDPKTRTWLSRDPIREAGGVNLYAYCENDPVNGCDPIGLETLGEYFYSAGLPYEEAPFRKALQVELINDLSTYKVFPQLIEDALIVAGKTIADPEQRAATIDRYRKIIGNYQVFNSGVHAGRAAYENTQAYRIPRTLDATWRGTIGATPINAVSKSLFAYDIVGGSFDGSNIFSGYLDGLTWVVPELGALRPVAQVERGLLQANRAVLRLEQPVLKAPLLLADRPQLLLEGAAETASRIADDVATLKSIRRYTERLVEGRVSSSNPATMLDVRDIQAAIANKNFRGAGTGFHELNFRLAEDAQGRGFLQNLNIDQSLATPGGFLNSRRPDYLFDGGGIFDIKPFRSSASAYDTTRQFLDIRGATGIMPVPLYYKLW